MKDPDYVTKIMVIWMTLDKLEGARTGSYFIETSGMKEPKQFTYQKPFGINFRYIHQVENHNNQRNTPISLKRKWATKFWPDGNFQFQNDGVVHPSMDFWRAFKIECPDNTIGFELGGECMT